MKVTTQLQEITQTTSAVAIQTKYGLHLTLLEYSNKGVIVTVLNSFGKETHRFLIDGSGAGIVLRDFTSGHTLTLGVTQ